MKNYWVSWYTNDRRFTLRSPWFVSGYVVGSGERTICAAIKEESEQQVYLTIRKAYKDPYASLTFRFCVERPDDWQPFTDRFKRSKWMEW